MTTGRRRYSKLTTTRFATAFTVLLAWCLTPWAPAAAATLAIPLLIAGILGLVGGYMAVGQLDMRTAAQAGKLEGEN